MLSSRSGATGSNHANISINSGLEDSVDPIESTRDTELSSYSRMSTYGALGKSKINVLGVVLVFINN